MATREDKVMVVAFELGKWTGRVVDSRDGGDVMDEVMEGRRAFRELAETIASDSINQLWSLGLLIPEEKEGRGLHDELKSLAVQGIELFIGLNQEASEKRVLRLSPIHPSVGFLPVEAQDD